MGRAIRGADEASPSLAQRAPEDHPPQHLPHTTGSIPPVHPVLPPVFNETDRSLRFFAWCRTKEGDPTILPPYLFDVVVVEVVAARYVGVQGMILTAGS
jgi:hypothetical protein